MTGDFYERLAKALDKLPKGFPQTSSHVETQILKKIFSSDEASLAGQLGRKMETVEVIAHRVGVSEEEASKKLMKMAKRGLLWSSERDGKQRFRLAPFIVGIYEAQEHMDHEFAHLVERYMYEGGAEGIMKPQPSARHL